MEKKNNQRVEDDFNPAEVQKDGSEQELQEQLDPSEESKQNIDSKDQLQEYQDLPMPNRRISSNRQIDETGARIVLKLAPMRCGEVQKRTHTFLQKFWSPWQSRYLVLDDGILSYFRESNDEEDEIKHVGSLNFDLYKF